MNKELTRFILLVRHGFTGIPDFKFDFIESEHKPGEEFEDTADRLTKEFHDIVKIQLLDSIPDDNSKKKYNMYFKMIDHPIVIRTSTNIRDVHFELATKDFIENSGTFSQFISDNRDLQHLSENGYMDYMRGINNKGSISKTFNDIDYYIVWDIEEITI